MCRRCFLVGLLVGQLDIPMSGPREKLLSDLCAGTRTCTASLGAVQDTLGSTLPAIGYTVTYAVANLMLVIRRLVTVLVA